ncbi:MAG: TolC family protein [Elusimicrobiota bacterium]
MIKRFLYIILLLISLLSVTCIYADDDDKDVSTYVRYAVENRREIRIADEQVTLAKLRVVNSARGLGPAVIMQYTESDGETMTDPYQAKAYLIKLNQSVFHGGKRYNTLRREMEGHKVARSEYRKAEQNVKYEALKTYYNALLNQEKNKDIDELIKRSASEFIVSEKKHTALIVTQVEFLEIEDLKEEMFLDKKMRGYELSLSVLDLKAACNIRNEVEVDLSGHTVRKAESDMDLEMENYKDLAMKNRPEIQGLEALVAQTGYDEKVAKGDKWPLFSIEGSVGKSGEAYVDQDLVMATEWSVFGNMEWIFWGNSLGGKYGQKKTEPSEILDASVRTKTTDRFIQLGILDRLDYYYNKQEKIISSAQAMKDLEDMKKKVEMEVEKSYNNMRISAELMELAKHKIELNKKKVEIVEKKNMLGEATSKDYIESMMKLSVEKDAYAESVVKYNIALAELKISSGIDVCPVRLGKKKG